MAVIKELNQANFDAAVASGIVLVDFWAPWCSQCKMLGKILEQAAEAAPAESVVGKINVDESKELAAKFQVSSLPKLILYKDGAAVKEFTGVLSKPKLISLLSGEF